MKKQLRVPKSIKALIGKKFQVMLHPDKDYLFEGTVISDCIEVKITSPNGDKPAYYHMDEVLGYIKNKQWIII